MGENTLKQPKSVLCHEKDLELIREYCDLEIYTSPVVPRGMAYFIDSSRIEELARWRPGDEPPINMGLVL